MSSDKDKHKVPQNKTGEAKDFDYTVKLNCDDDLIAMTVSLYKLFIANGILGQEAKTLYEHLIFTARMQYGNPRIKATDTYLKIGLKWGRDKIKRSKAFLSNAGLIEYIMLHDDETGRFNGGEILVKKMWDENSLNDWLNNRDVREKPKDLNPDLRNNEYYSKKRGDVQDSEKKSLKSKSRDKNKHITIGPEITPTGAVLNSEPTDDNNSRRLIQKRGERQQTNKVIKRETYKKEEEETKVSSPSEYSKMKFSQFCDYIVSGIEDDGRGKFSFCPSVLSAFEKYEKKHGRLWVVDQIEKYKSTRSPSRFRRFINDDIEDFLIDGDFTLQKEISSSKEPAHCPVCDSLVSGNMVECGKCGLELERFSESDHVEAHKQWYEGYRNGKR